MEMEIGSGGLMVRIGAVALLAVLVVSSPAFGDCGWALWSVREWKSEVDSKGIERSRDDKDVWEVLDGYQQIEGCQAAIQSMRQKESSGDLGDKVKFKSAWLDERSRLFVIFRADGSTVSTQDRYACLPGSLDPRPPQGL